MRPFVYAGLAVLILAVWLLVQPRYGGLELRGPWRPALTQLSTFKTAVEMFRVDAGRYPDGLGDLLVQPTNATGWHGPYLDGPVPRDPWGHVYVYRCPGRHNLSSYDVWSAGPDGQDGTDDDIGNWTTQ